MRLGIFLCGLALLAASPSRAEVVGVDVAERKPWQDGKVLGPAGAYELIRGTIRYEIDPASLEAAQVTDIKLAPVNARGKVEYRGPFLMLRPADPSKADGMTLIEIPNRGGDQTNGALFDADGFALTKPDAAKLIRAGLLERGTTMAWIGWQARLKPDAFGLAVPTGTGQSRARADFWIDGKPSEQKAFSLPDQGFYCAASTNQAGATMVRKRSFDDPGEPVDPSRWAFARQERTAFVADACAVHFIGDYEMGAYELVYPAEPAPLVGLGQQAVRDFVGYLKFGTAPSPLIGERQAYGRAVVGFGYSQSARFLRDYLYRGFNADEQGRRMFDGMMIVAAGAGRGSFHHRYSLPGQAGNSVGSSLRAVDYYPFADMPVPDFGSPPPEGVLDRALASGTAPKVFHIYSGSEYWARAGSLLHATADGTRDVPLAPDTRFYFYEGTPHGPRKSGLFTDKRSPAAYPYNDNIDLLAGTHAMAVNMRDWLLAGREPPANAYPTVAAGTLVDPLRLSFPALKNVRRPRKLPPVWQLDFGPDFRTSGIISEPPRTGPRYRLLVPAVDVDGNETGGIAGLMRRLPLGSLTAWNYTEPDFEGFGYLSGLQGSRLPFAPTRAAREAAGDPRPSLEERYGDKAAYLGRAGEEIGRLIAERQLTENERPVLVERLGMMWDLQEKLYAAWIRPAKTTNPPTR